MQINVLQSLGYETIGLVLPKISMSIGVVTVISLASVAVICGFAIDQTEKVEVTLYYESLCPYSRAFILNQLVPAWNLLNPYMVVQLVPYGLTKRKYLNGHWAFDCQHGQEECNMDIVSACAVEMLEKAETDRLLKFIYCLEDNLFYIPALNSTIKCAKEVNILLKSLVYCVANSEEMMLRFAERTENVQPFIKALPAIQLNGIYDPALQREIRQNLVGKLCEYLEHCYATEVNVSTEQTTTTKEPTTTPFEEYEVA